MRSTPAVILIRPTKWKNKSKRIKKKKESKHNSCWICVNMSSRRGRWWLKFCYFLKCLSWTVRIGACVARSLLDATQQQPITGRGTAPRNQRNIRCRVQCHRNGNGGWKRATSGHFIHLDLFHCLEQSHLWVYSTLSIHCWLKKKTGLWAEAIKWDE